LLPEKVPEGLHHVIVAIGLRRWHWTTQFPFTSEETVMMPLAELEPRNVMPEIAVDGPPDHLRRAPGTEDRDKDLAPVLQVEGLKPRTVALRTLQESGGFAAHRRLEEPTVTPVERPEVCIFPITIGDSARVGAYAIAGDKSAQNGGPLPPKDRAGGIGIGDNWTSFRAVLRPVRR